MIPDRAVHSDEARRTLRHLLDAVEHDGEHVTILRYQTPAAVIVPVEWHRQALAAIGVTGPEAEEADHAG